ncbi:hypothetical protein SPSPH_028060 [Sporomusa sphaeroides DSM 2875]
MQSPLRIPAGGAAAAAASSACRQPCIIRLTKKKTIFSSLIDQAAPLSAGTTDTTLWLPVRSLRRSADAALSSSAPVRPPLRLEPYPARRLSLVRARGRRPEHSLALALGLPGERGTVGWPRTLRGASAGHSGRTARKTTGRPSRAPCRPPGTTNKARTAPPGHLPPLVWLDASKPFVPCRGRARPAPWTRKACVHSPSSLPPEPPIPPEWRRRQAVGRD